MPAELNHPLVPFTQARRASGTCRSPHSTRNCVTASRRRKIPRQAGLAGRDPAKPQTSPNGWPTARSTSIAPRCSTTSRWHKNSSPTPSPPRRAWPVSEYDALQPSSLQGLTATAGADVDVPDPPAELVVVLDPLPIDDVVLPTIDVVVVVDDDVVVVDDEVVVVVVGAGRLGAGLSKIFSTVVPPPE